MPGKCQSTLKMEIFVAQISIGQKSNKTRSIFVDERIIRTPFYPSHFKFSWVQISSHLPPPKIRTNATEISGFTVYSAPFKQVFSVHETLNKRERPVDKVVAKFGQKQKEVCFSFLQRGDFCLSNLLTIKHVQCSWLHCAVSCPNNRTTIVNGIQRVYISIGKVCCHAWLIKSH